MARSEWFLIPAIAATAFVAEAQAPRTPNDSLTNERAIQLRLASLSPAPGYLRMQSAANGDTLYVSQHSIADDDHIARARAYQESGRLTIDVLLTVEGAARLRQATRASVGQRLAVLIGGRLAKSVPIVSPLSLRDRRVTIGVEVDERTAREFAAGIAAKWPLRLPAPGEKD